MAGTKATLIPPGVFLVYFVQCNQPIMRHLLALLFLPIAAAAYGQCGPYKHHPVWPDTVGSAYVVPTDCDDGENITGCLWDYGDTDWSTDGLSVGTHSVVLLAGSTPVETLNFEIEQLAWDLNQNVFQFVGEIAVGIYAEVPHCPSQIFDGHHCPIDPDSTEVYLLQNGVAIDSISPVYCLGISHEWTFLPAGYSYQTYLVDRSVCGSYSYDEPVQTFSLADAEFVYFAEPSSGSNNGTITVTDIAPSPGTLPPPPMPLTGALTLYTWPDDVSPIGDAQSGTSGYWEGLAPGQYWLQFVPDVLCNAIDTVITIDAFTDSEEIQGERYSSIRIWPVPTTDVLHWSSGALANVWVTDLQGRVLISERNVTHLNVSALAPGSYVLRMEDGRQQPFVKR
jgi:hypothetical protein